MPKSSARQSLVKVAGIDGYFMTKSGGDITADTNKVYDGGKLVPEVLAGPAEADNVTVSRAFDPVRDNTTLRRLRQQVGRWSTTISVTPTDRNLSPIPGAKPTVYSNALLVGLVEPEYDASSGDAQVFELEFAVGAFA